MSGEWTDADARAIRRKAIRNLAGRFGYAALILSAPIWVPVGKILVAMRESVALFATLPSEWREHVSGAGWIELATGKRRSLLWLALFPRSLARAPKATFRKDQTP